MKYVKKILIKVAKRFKRYISVAKVWLKAQAACAGRLIFPPKVSVIIPVYNGERYIEHTLQNIANQSFFDIEILVIDDGSKDNTAKIVRDLARKDRRVKYIGVKNAGPGAARNIGVSEAKGKYLFFLDSDDLITKNLILSLHETIEKTRSDVAIGYYKRLKDDSTQINPAVWIKNLHAKEVLKSSVCANPAIYLNTTVWGKLFNRTFWEANKFAFIEGILYEDQVIMSQIYSTAASVDILDKKEFLLWRIRGDESSITQMVGSISDLSNRIKAAKLSLEYIKDLQSYELYKARLLQYLSHDFIDPICKIPSSSKEYVDILRSFLHELTNLEPSVTEEAPPRLKVAYKLLEDGNFDVLNKYILATEMVDRNVAVKRVGDYACMDLEKTCYDAACVLPQEYQNMKMTDESIEGIAVIDRVRVLAKSELTLQGWMFLTSVPPHKFNYSVDAWLTPKKPVSSSNFESDEVKIPVHAELKYAIEPLIFDKNKYIDYSKNGVEIVCDYDYLKTISNDWVLVSDIKAGVYSRVVRTEFSLPEVSQTKIQGKAVVLTGISFSDDNALLFHYSLVNFADGDVIGLKVQLNGKKIAGINSCALQDKSGLVKFYLNGKYPLREKKPLPTGIGEAMYFFEFAASEIVANGSELRMIDSEGVFEQELKPCDVVISQNMKNTLPMRLNNENMRLNYDLFCDSMDGILKLQVFPPLLPTEIGTHNTFQNEMRYFPEGLYYERGQGGKLNDAVRINKSIKKDTVLIADSLKDAYQFSKYEQSLSYSNKKYTFFWVVKDHADFVPSYAKQLIYGSKPFFEMLSRAEYIVTSLDLPKFYKMRKGQLIVDSLDKIPNCIKSDSLPDFSNDVLESKTKSARDKMRESFGVPSKKTLVLITKDKTGNSTDRDASNLNYVKKAVKIRSIDLAKIDRIDYAKIARNLGDKYTVLMRNPDCNFKWQQYGSSNLQKIKGVINVSEYPDIVSLVQMSDVVISEEELEKKVLEITKANGQDFDIESLIVETVHSKESNYEVMG
jgi:CDP-glycerol glycerophosphotransferase